jgi:hypothetical protein
MRWSSVLLVPLLTTVLAGCASIEEAGDIPESAGTPLLQPFSPYAPERDDPPALRAELIRRDREGMALLRKAAQEPADAEQGCVRASPTLKGGPPQPKRWLPQPPKIQARLLGRQVQVDVELQGHPTSLPCRPWVFTIVVTSASGENLGGVSSYRLFAPGFRTVPRHFRVLGQIPIGGSAPFHLSVNTESTLGRSTYVERDLACPGRGCLTRPIPKLHDVTIPSPIVPLRHVTPSALLRSFKETLGWDPQLQRYRNARCPTTATCTIGVDAPLRGARGIARYRIQGEQVDGCWLGTLLYLDRRPQEAEILVPQTIGGCVTWS